MNPQSFNRYSYCLNNPLKYIDPSGHQEDDDAIQVIPINPTILILWMSYSGNTFVRTPTAVEASIITSTTHYTIIVPKDTDTIHGVLDVVGYLNPAADVANAGMYIEEGGYVSAVLSGIGAVPLVGDSIKFVGDIIKTAWKPIKWIGKRVGNIFGNLLGNRWTVEKVFKEAVFDRTLRHGGKQYQISGDSQKIFDDLIVDAEQLETGVYRLKDGTIVGYHKSSGWGVGTIDINQGGEISKVRVR